MSGPHHLERLRALIRAVDEALDALVKYWNESSPPIRTQTGRGYVLTGNRVREIREIYFWKRAASLRIHSLFSQPMLAARHCCHKRTIDDVVRFINHREAP